MKTSNVNETKVFFDDLRNTTEDFLIVRSSQDFKNYVIKNGCPSFISFDHDLGGDDTAMVFIHWLIEYDLDNQGSIIPSTFDFNIHSANPVGVKNIDGLLKSYLNQKEKNNAG